MTAPLTPRTRGLVDRRRVGLLPDGAFVIVVSRGNIVDEDALVDEVRSGRIAGAGLDTTGQEPLPPDSPLWAVDNILISPHCSALSPSLWAGRRETYAENLRRFLAGEPFLYVCDKREGLLTGLKAEGKAGARARSHQDALTLSLSQRERGRDSAAMAHREDLAGPLTATGRRRRLDWSDAASCASPLPLGEGQGEGVPMGAGRPSRRRAAPRA